MTAYRRAADCALAGVTRGYALARAARSSAAKSPPALAKKSSAKRTAKAGKDSENFELRSLQNSFDKQRRYKASAAELQAFYEQMLLIRRFEERAGQLYGLSPIATAS